MRRLVTGIAILGYNPETCRYDCIVREEVTTPVQSVLLFPPDRFFHTFSERIETIENKLQLTKPQIDNILYEIRNKVF